MDLGNDDKENPKRQRNLLVCCVYLAEQNGFGSFAEYLEQLLAESGHDSSRKVLVKVVKAARQKGLRTIINRPTPDQLQEAALLFPVLVESRDGNYFILTGIRKNELENSFELSVLSPLANEGFESIKLPLSRFMALWTGSIFHFQQINTALSCFSLVASEHKIEVTQDRIRHEYNLGQNEIPTNTLLRISKDLGLKARQITIDWNRLVHLNKAYPAIVRLKTGRHMVVAGVIPETEETETAIACYDPMEGSGGGHLRFTRKDFEAL